MDKEMEFNFTTEEMTLMRQGKTNDLIKKKRAIYLNAIKEGRLEYAFIDSCRIVDGKNRCPCGGSPFANERRSKHIKTKKHINYMELKKQEIQETALPLPATSAEIQKIPIPDKEPEPIAEIPSSVPDSTLTKEEIRKQKKKDYMRDYMKGYHAKRYNEDPVYREYRKNMSTKSTCKMGSRYVKAYQYIKENGINIFDENGN